LNAQSSQDAVIPARLLQPAAAVAIIVGIVIGAGIFKTPSMVAGVTGDVGWMLSIWLVGALISVAGALCYAELSAKHPHAGGDYHFLELAYGRRLSFLYAWAKATVINTGSIALLAFVFGEYMTKVIDLGPASTALWAIGIVVALTLVNWIGLQASSTVQMVLTVLEVLGLVAVVVAGFLVSAPADATPEAFSKTPALGMAGLALVFVLLTFGGWNEAAYISAEVRGGPRRIVGVIILSLLVITGIYILVNLALVHALGLKGLASSKAPAADVMGLAFGVWGQKAIGLFVAFAALTSINATMIVGARSNFAVGLSWGSLRFMGRWNVSSGTPTVALLVQGGIALALVIFGTQQRDGFGAMVEFTAPVFWTFLFLVGVSVFILHNRPFQGERFDVPLYPLTPLLFCASCAYLAYSSTNYAASQNAVHISFAVMAVGVVALVILEMLERRGAVATRSP
jgi:APA family basic amino acid/polyamine antiporter